MRVPQQRTTLEELAPFTAPEGLASYVEHIESAGLKVYAVDLTTTDIAMAGLRVARVLVPGLYCNAPAAFPLLGGYRLYTEPVLHGWTDSPVTEDTLVRHPLPHT
jgi:ribosomal protein S12 methylthiotransferase accessory factor